MSNNIRTFLAAALAVETDSIEPNEEIILDILRRRLTKKERKLLMQEMEGVEKRTIMQQLALDAERYDAVREALYKKLRHPKIRKEIINGN